MKLAKGRDTEWALLVSTHEIEPSCKNAVALAQRWAIRMEGRIAAGESVVQCADEAMRDVLIDALAKRELGAFDSANWIQWSIKVLANFWEHGHELKEWILGLSFAAMQTANDLNKRGAELRGEEPPPDLTCDADCPCGRGEGNGNHKRREAITINLTINGKKIEPEPEEATA